MSDHEMAYNMAYTMTRQYGVGTVFQRCEPRAGCPPLEKVIDVDTGKVTMARPPHDCKGRWYGAVEAGFTANGTRRRITVSGKSKSIVRRRQRDKRLELERAGTANTRRTVTVAKWAEEWIKNIEPHVRPSSLTTDTAAVRWIVETIGHVKLANLTPGHVRAVENAIRDAEYSSSTALRYYGTLVRLLKAAAVDGYNIPPNVLLSKAPVKAVNDRQAIPLPDAIKILRHLTLRDDDGDLIIPDSSRWSLAFLQGIRQAEALGLTWDQVDLENGTLTICWQAKSLKYRDRSEPSRGFVVPDGYEVRHLAGAAHLVRPKSASGMRVMPLVPWAVAALADWRERAPENAHGLVWPGRSNASGDWPRNAGSDREQWERIQAAVGVAHPAGRPYHPHEIRHATATLLMELKVPESVRIAIMGHSTIASTRGYEYVDVTQTREALVNVGRLLELM